MKEQAVLIGAILILGLLTFCYRFSFTSSKGRLLAEKIPQDFLRLLGPATFSAIIANNLLSTPAEPEEFRRKIVVAVLALGVAALSKSTIATVVFGLSLLAFLQYGLGL